MKNTHLKTILREIRRSFGRFAAITAITALGAGFLVGLMSATPDMKLTLNRYYRQEAMPDFTIKSTMGITRSDLKKMKQEPYVRRAMAVRVIDEKMTLGSGEEVTGRICGLPLSKNRTDDFINKLTLVKGKFPEKKGECLLEKPTSHMAELSVGDTLKLSDYDRDTFACRKFTVVGIAESPSYFCSADEPSNVGSGRTGAILYTNEDAFSMKVCTDLWITLKESAKQDTFSREYADYADKTAEKLESLADERCEVRYTYLQNKGKRELKKARNKLDRERKTAEEKLDSALAELNRGRRELDSAQKQLDDARQEVSRGRRQLDSGQKQLQRSKQQLDQSEKQVGEARRALNAGADLPDSVRQQIARYDRGLAQYNSGMQKLQSRRQSLDAASRKISANEKELKTAERDLARGSDQYYRSKAKAEKKLSEGQEKIDEAAEELREMDYPEWFVLGRSANVSYSRYKIDVEKVGDIASVFPIFFFLVAALVSLTTMTRMVEEERTQIGTLKALGYSRGKIISKYMIYCGAATAVGCIIGLLVGIHLLPTVIYEAYRSQYALPDLILERHWTYIITACLAEAACTMGAAYFACRRSLKETPASLMLPRAPKAGKRIFLERITPVWNRLSFSHKATARNIFRYKKHLLMTVIGIAGCTALILTGFGLKDSMSNLADKQFDEIFHYDMVLNLDDGEGNGGENSGGGAGSDRQKNDSAPAADSLSSGSSRKIDGKILEFLTGKESMFLHRETMTARPDEAGKGKAGESRESAEKISFTVQVPRQEEKMAEMVRLYSRSTGKFLPFDRNSVLMTEKAADDLGLSPGDTFLLKNSDEREKKVKLTGITENYAGCYIYMGRSAYQKAFGTPDYNGFLVKSGITDQKMQDEVSVSLTDLDSVSSVSFTGQEQASYETILSSIDFIVAVLIFCAGALAAVVLYNLTNININERTKELATLKVLGYYPGEVARYVFREIALLTCFGTLAGLVLGTGLHRYVIVRAESASMMMGREIDPLSFVLAAVITLLFSLAVDFLMIFKLKKIGMAESMKAVD